ncbi:hypothetical protein GCM10009678_65460 [Actinomadura kijaniata]
MPKSSVAPAGAAGAVVSAACTVCWWAAQPVARTVARAAARKRLMAALYPEIRNYGISQIRRVAKSPQSVASARVRGNVAG